MYPSSHETKYKIMPFTISAVGHKGTVLPKLMMV